MAALTTYEAAGIVCAVVAAVAACLRSFDLL